jgi:hypothetical protein
MHPAKNGLDLSVFRKKNVHESGILILVNRLKWQWKAHREGGVDMH